MKGQMKTLHAACRMLSRMMASTRIWRNVCLREIETLSLFGSVLRFTGTRIFVGWTLIFLFELVRFWGAPQQGVPSGQKTVAATDATCLKPLWFQNESDESTFSCIKAIENGLMVLPVSFLVPSTTVDLFWQWRIRMSKEFPS